MGTHVILIFVLGTLVSLLSAVMGRLFPRPRLPRPVEQPVLEIVESADPRNIGRIKATDEGIKRLVAHEPDPVIETGLAAQHHGQARTQHTNRVARRTSLIGTQQADQEGIG